MHKWLMRFLGLNWLLMLFTFALLGYGIYSIYSATVVHGLSFWRVQLTWVFVALPVFLVLSMMNYKWVRWGVFPIYFAGIVALIAGRFFGIEVFGARRWLDLGFVSFQPSQLAILGGMLAVAVFLEFTKDKPDWMRLLGTGAIVFPPWFLIFSEPDLGSSLVWIPMVLGMLFVGGIAKRWLASFLLLTASTIPIAVYFVLKEYQVKRITTFLNPNLDPLGDGYNINQSLLAIGSGGMDGKGLASPDSLNALGFLPRTIVHNDFIFSVMGEQHGFVGAIALLVGFALFFLTALLVATMAKDDLGRLLCVGGVAVLFTHTAMNIGMTISVTPITGLPLPLISYGGTFLLITMSLVGLMQSVWVYRKDKPKEREIL